MTTAAAAIDLPTPSLAPMLEAGLAELFQMGLKVARVSMRLAEIEARALDALDDAAEAAMRGIVATADSMAAAREAGLAADASDAARDAIAARMVSITATFDRAARAVRRTAALIRRLEQPARAAAAAGSVLGAGVAGKPRAASAAGVERLRDDERLDDAEVEDEIGDRPDAEIIRDICRDLGLELTQDAESPLQPATLAAVRAACARPEGREEGRAVAPEHAPDPSGRRIRDG